MTPGRFDALFRILQARRSRRTALRVAGLGLGAGLAVRSPFRAMAQDGASTPVTVDGVTLTDGAFLFVQSAASGTFAANPGAGTLVADGAATPGGGADYLLTLEGHAGNTIYFSDRPERIFGEGPTDQFIAGLGFSPANPPNAALVTSDADGNEDILVVELLSPVYDANAGSVAYGVNILSDYEGGLDFVAGRQADEDLGATFGEASLFIDDCPDLTTCRRSFGDTISTDEGPLPGGSVGQCWHWSEFACIPCNGNSNDYYDDLCNNTYSDCDGDCGAA